MIEEYINPSALERWRIDIGPKGDVFRVHYLWMIGSGTELEWKWLGEQIIGPRTNGEHTMGLLIKNNGEVYWQLDGAEGRVEFGGIPAEMQKIDMVTLTAIGASVMYTRCDIKANNGN